MKRRVRRTVELIIALGIIIPTAFIAGHYKHKLLYTEYGFGVWGAMVLFIAACYLLATAYRRDWWPFNSK